MGPARVTDKSAVAWENAGLAAAVQNKAIAPAKLRAVHRRVFMKPFSFSKCVSLPRVHRQGRTALFSSLERLPLQRAERSLPRGILVVKHDLLTPGLPLFSRDAIKSAKLAREVPCLVKMAVLFAEKLEGECRSESTPVARPSY